MQASQFFTRSVDAETLYSAADVDGDGLIGLQDASSFFAGALLPPASMNAIWSACATPVSLPVGPGGSCMAITRSTFMNALLLISASQQSVSPLTPSVAAAAAPLPPPAFIALSNADCVRYQSMFGTLGQQRAPPNECAKLFAMFGANPATLNAVWALSDRDHDNMLTLSEFLIAMALLAHASRGMPLPTAVPATVLCSIPGMHSLKRAQNASPMMQQQQQQPSITLAATPSSSNMGASSVTMMPALTPASSTSNLSSGLSSTSSSSSLSNSGSSNTLMPTTTLSSGSTSMTTTPAVSPATSSSNLTSSVRVPSSDSLFSSGAGQAPSTPRGAGNVAATSVAELEMQLQEAKNATAQLRAAQKTATATNSELVLQRAEQEENLRRLQTELAALSEAVQAQDSATQQAMGIVQEATSNMTAAQTLQQRLQEEQAKQTERVQTARARAEQLTAEAAALRAELQRVSAETEVLKQQAEEKKAQAAPLGDLTELFLKQMEGHSVDADELLSQQEKN